MKADSRFTWFRMYSEVLGDRKMDRAASLSGLSHMEVLGAWTGLLCLASDSPVRGFLLLTESMPLTQPEIAEYVGTDTETMDAALAAFERLGMLSLDANGVYAICQWAGRQYESDTSTERVRKFRERQAEQVTETPEAPTVAGDAERSRNVTVTPQSQSQSQSQIRTDTEVSGSARPEPEPAPAPNRRSDPRSKHPAIMAARAATGAKHYPPIELYDSLILALGENPDTAKLGLCRQSWVERGYNPGAWTWATEWYAGGVPAKGARASPGGGGNGNGLSYGNAAIEAYLKRGGDGNT